MKIANIILLFLSAALFVVGAHLTISQGIMVAYPLLMFAVAVLFWYQYRNKSAKPKKQNGPNQKKKQPKMRR